MADALHGIPAAHGTPGHDELAGFLARWPAVEPAVATALARALHRYWTGDSEGAAYTVLPRIESIARRLVLDSERGVYRLQHEHVPGQYAGLGRLLPIVDDEYGLGEPRLRYLSTLLRHPAGLNLRNLMAHGFVGEPGPGVAAALLHAALLLGSTERPTARSPPAPGGSGDMSPT